MSNPGPRKRHSGLKLGAKYCTPTPENNTSEIIVDLTRNFRRVVSYMLQWMFICVISGV